MKTTEWNIQDYLKTPEDLANFLESALEENDYEFLKIAVTDAIAALRRKELLKHLELLANNIFK
jgi:DNA-binding phage protein